MSGASLGGRERPASPLGLSIGGGDVLVSPAADWLYGYDPATGREIYLRTDKAVYRLQNDGARP